MSESRVFQINASDGGVPKLPMHSGEITPLGIEGDRQNDRVNHGGPDKALCLYSLERLVALQAEGHPIYPGSTGENLTLSGVDWAQVYPGTRLQLGGEAVIEITQYATPCTKLVSSFADGQFQRMHQDRHPGWARVYARVLEPGPVRIGDRVEVLEPREG
jgi:MOSC domain-containing protein YiiM